ncbi:MAG: hypothetical protein ACR2FY_04575 [Pirellulaceae bacterium]
MQIKSQFWFQLRLVAWIPLLICLGLTPSVRADRFAFLVGVGDYDPQGSDKRDLPNTVAETEELEAILKAQRDASGNSYYKKIIKISDNSTTLQPTRDNILEKGLKELREEMLLNNPVGARDHSLLIVLNGHGLELEADNYDFTFCPKDASKQDRNSRIAIPEFLDKLRTAAGKPIPDQVFFVVNACRNDPLAGQNFDSEGRGAKNKNVTIPVRRSAILFACDTGQESLIDTQVDRGPRSFFMSHLMAAWMGAADGVLTTKPKDGQVDLLELESYLASNVKDQVKKIKKVGQNPVVYSRAVKDDWIINASISASVRDANTIVGDVPAALTYTKNWKKKTFVGVDFSGETIDNKELTGSRFIRCRLAGTKFLGDSSLYDVAFVNCELRGMDLTYARHVDKLVYEGTNTGASKIIWGPHRAPKFDLDTGEARP